MSERDTEATAEQHPVTDTDKPPEQLREEIADTREQLGETVEQLAAKADVKARAQEAVEERKEAVREKVDEVKTTTQQTAATGVQEARRKPYIPAAAGIAILALAVIVVRRRRS
jgi:ElaB/YqjD/DUF883 family membrane-anchored ribosome-binding protein